MSKYPDQPPPYGFQQGQPQQGMYPPQMQQHHQMHLPQMQQHTQQAAVVIVANPGVGPNSTLMTCPSCHHQIGTKPVSESTTKTHLIAILLCVFCCWPCVCLPYCMDSCKNINHYCPKCNAFLGTYSS